jgi:hypothetical protein
MKPDRHDRKATEVMAELGPETLHEKIAEALREEENRQKDRVKKLQADVTSLGAAMREMRRRNREI